MALSKPAGLPVFPPHSDPEGDCLLARLLRAEPAQADHAWPSGFGGGLAHRLDVATSGQVIAATSPAQLQALRARFAAGVLHKHYLLLSWRDVPWQEHTLQQPIAHDRRRRTRMVVQRGRDTPHRGRWYPAWTRLRRAGRVVGEDQPLSAWTAEIHTGVTHQIRVHAAFAGLALAGDHLYGGGVPTSWARAQADALGLPRPPFHLHHHGLVGPGLDPPRAPLPLWWPVVLGTSTSPETP